MDFYLAQQVLNFFELSNIVSGSNHKNFETCWEFAFSSCGAFLFLLFFLFGCEIDFFFQLVYEIIFGFLCFLALALSAERKKTTFNFQSHFFYKEQTKKKSEAKK